MRYSGEMMSAIYARFHRAFERFFQRFIMLKESPASSQERILGEIFVTN